MMWQAFVMFQMLMCYTAKDRIENIYIYIYLEFLELLD